MTATTASRTITAKDLKVGDIVLEIWGTTLAQPCTIKTANISATYGGGAVTHDRGGMWPVRANDTRPIVIVAAS